MLLRRTIPGIFGIGHGRKAAFGLGLLIRRTARNMIDLVALACAAIDNVPLDRRFCWARAAHWRNALEDERRSG